ncbi:MAG: hypothetical protein ACLQMT_01040 [Candidatus Acidiferrales bacterium]
MKLLPILALGIAMAIANGKAEVDFEGCQDPDAIAKALTELHQSDWHAITLGKLRSIWPRELSDEECDPNGCAGAQSLDRVISGRYECCATFLFRMQGSETAPQTEWLHNVVIDYSTRNRSDLVAVAKKFTAALGLQGSDLNAVGKDRDQTFGWATSGKNGKELSLIFLTFHSEGDHWQLILNSSQNIPE